MMRVRCVAYSRRNSGKEVRTIQLQLSRKQAYTYLIGNDHAR